MNMEWNIETAFKVAKAFAQHAGLQGVPLRLVSFRQNALFCLPNPPLTGGVRLTGAEGRDTTTCNGEELIV